jgi:hypothetical protein
MRVAAVVVALVAVIVVAIVLVTHHHAPSPACVAANSAVTAAENAVTYWGNTSDVVAYENALGNAVTAIGHAKEVCGS